MKDKLFFVLLRILRKIPLIRNIDFIDSFLMERVGELEDDSEVLWISDPHTNIHFWKENGKFYTSKEFHLSKGGLEEDFEEWSKKVGSIS